MNFSLNSNEFFEVKFVEIKKLISFVLIQSDAEQWYFLWNRIPKLIFSLKWAASIEIDGFLWEFNFTAINGIVEIRSDLHIFHTIQWYPYVYNSSLRSSFILRTNKAQERERQSERQRQFYCESQPFQRSGFSLTYGPEIIRVKVGFKYSNSKWALEF